MLKNQMKGRTFKTIIILIGLLFINIEVAQAGLVQKIKSFILHEFSGFQIIYLATGTALLAFFVYVLMAPVIIGNQKSIWLNLYPNNRHRNQYKNKKAMVKRIASILNGPNNQ